MVVVVKFCNTKKRKTKSNGVSSAKTSRVKQPPAALVWNKSKGKSFHGIVHPLSIASTHASTHVELRQEERGAGEIVEVVK